MKIRTIVVPMSMTSHTSLRVTKELITLTELHLGLVKFPTESILSLQSQGATVPNSLIQISSRCLRSGVLRLGLLVGCYIYSSILTLKDNI